MSEPTHATRRRFLADAAASTAALSAVAHAAPAAEKKPAKNETLQLGVIGCGGRARRRLMPRIKEIEGAKITAVCDVYKDHLEAGRHVAGGEAFTTWDQHELLGRDDIDAVVIATPDHWHVPLTIEACEAGKDVYVEKPLTHNLEEGEAVIEVQNRTERVVQVGAQQRSMPQFARARRIVADGTLGAIHKVHMQWNRNTLPFRKPNIRIDKDRVHWQRFLGNAPDQPFDPWRMRRWRWVWDFGAGILGDLMVHWLDATHRVLGIESLPKRIVALGDHYATGGVWETPDTIQTIFEYPDHDLQIHFEGTIVNDAHKAFVEIMGSDATLYLDRGRYELHPQPRRDVKPDRFVPGKGPRGANFYDNMASEKAHLIDWLEAVRARRKPVEPAEAGVQAAAVAHLANRAYREQKVVTT